MKTTTAGLVAGVVLIVLALVALWGVLAVMRNPNRQPESATRRLAGWVALGGLVLCLAVGVWLIVGYLTG